MACELWISISFFFIIGNDGLWLVVGGLRFEAFAIEFQFFYRSGLWIVVRLGN